MSPSSAVAVPFECYEGLIWIQVQVPQSTRPLNFLFDTGAAVSVINKDTARALGLRTGSRIRVQGVHTTMTGHWPARLTATAGGMVLPSEYLALDLGKLAKSCGRPLDGLLGADFIQGRVVEIDFASRQLRFLDAVPTAKSDVVLPLRVCDGRLCVPVRVNNREPQWLRLDTGCATALQWVTSDAKPSATARKTAIGLVTLTIPQIKATVSLGSQHFDQVPVGIHRRAIFPGESGLLGNGLLGRFKTVTIDVKSGRVVLGQSLSAH